MTSRPSSSGRSGLELLLLAQLGDARLELVHAAFEGPGPGRVARGAVRAGELVQPVEQGPGVAHVAAHGPVGPAQPVGVEAQVQLDELGHDRNVVLGVAQRRQAVAGHAGAHHLVVVERHPARAEGARAGLADVVEQRGQAQEPVRARLVHHGQGVGEDVLVAVDGVLLEGKAGQLGEELAGKARLHHEPQARRRLVDDDELVELVADPLRRDDGQAVVHGLDGGGDLGHGLEAETGDEARGAQHAQGVVPERHLGPEAACAAGVRRDRPARRRGRRARDRGGAAPWR